MTAEIPSALKVLVVDDEPLIRWSLAETLEASGCTVVEASDATTTHKLIHDGGIDVVVLDYRLPDSNSLDLLAAVRRAPPSC